MPTPKAVRSSSTEPASARSIDHRAHVIDAQAVFRNDAAQQPLVGAGPVLQRPLEIGKIFLGDGDGFRLVLHHHVDHAVGRLHADGTDFVGMKDAEAAAFDHRRPAHADGGVLGGDDDVAAAEQRRVAGEAATGIDADQRHQPRQLRIHPEGRGVEAARAHRIGVAGPSAAAFGEEDDRQPPAARPDAACGPSSGDCASLACRPAPYSRRPWRSRARSRRGRDRH